MLCLMSQFNYLNSVTLNNDILVNFISHLLCRICCSLQHLLTKNLLPGRLFLNKSYLEKKYLFIYISKVVFCRKVVENTRVT